MHFPNWLSNLAPQSAEKSWICCGIVHDEMWRVMIEVLEKSWNFQSSIGNTVRDYFTDTASPHFFNAAIRCIVLIKTAFSQARHPSSPWSLLLRK